MIFLPLSLLEEGPAAASPSKVPAGEMFTGLIHHAGRVGRPDAAVAEDPLRGGGLGLHAHGGGPSVVLTADPKPRLRWTADLHDRFVDAVVQLGGPDSEHSDISSSLKLPFSLLCQPRSRAVVAHARFFICLVEVATHRD